MPAIAEQLIFKTPNVMGGEACIRQTRISVWGLVQARRLGVSDVKLLSGYPGLTPEDLEAAWDYYAHHPEEIDTAIREQEEAE